MIVKIEYQDISSFNMEEVIAQAKRNYGKTARVEVRPDSMLPHDMLYFALQQMTVHEQLSLFFSSGATYKNDLLKLKAEILYKVEEILNDVLIDTEEKVSE